LPPKAAQLILPSHEVTEKLLTEGCDPVGLGGDQTVNSSMASCVLPPYCRGKWGRYMWGRLIGAEKEISDPEIL